MMTSCGFSVAEIIFLGQYYNGYGYMPLPPPIDPRMYGAAPYGGYPMYGGHQQQQQQQPDLHSCGFGSQTPHSSDYALYPKLDPNDATPPPAPNFSGAATSMPPEFSPYVSPSPTPKNELFSFLSLKIDTIELMGSAFSYKSCQEWRAILTDHIKVLCSIQFSSVTFLDFIRREAKNGLTRHR
ncbi:hypothetical protein F2Q68_00019985 [Brassica cretica]|uniref:Uncharacterized protein n=1 Tax=Brassica cretica TaxID=69181 RepID=A0A8S9FXC4_BRACR|nr:hypothetical protein F2Q68_00019985 [Brassica cretica]